MKHTLSQMIWAAITFMEPARLHFLPPGTTTNDEKYPNIKRMPSRMIWKAISFMGLAGLHFLPPGTTMNGEKYVDFLNSKLELLMRTHSCEIFMHDGAPCHRSKVVKKWSKKMSKCWSGHETVRI